MRLRSQQRCNAGSRYARPQGASTTWPTAACIRPSNAVARAKRASGSVLVVVAGVLADTADDDLVRFDRHLDLAVSGPVLGVHGVVGDGRVEPQAVALLAVVERALQG